MDESRKLYEEWFNSRYGNLSIPPKQRLVMRTYSWAAWQASRAAIEISVPANDFGNTSSPPGEGWTYGEAMDVLDGIRAAGIKVKERA